jgi:hypothetical protein
LAPIVWLVQPNGEGAAVAATLAAAGLIAHARLGPRAA